MAMLRLKPSGRIGDNMKKILGLVALFVIIISSCFYFFTRQPKNIFDEMYQETEKTYLGNNVFNKLKDVEAHKYQEYSDDSRFYPSVVYEENALPDSYEKIAIDFNFKSEAQLSLISFEKRIESNVSIKMWTVYSHKERSLKKFVKIVLKKADTKNYIEDEAQVKSYLEQYGITAKDLDSYYDEIVNQKVLKDWCSIYDSKYSPSNYGEVKVETQWENW